MRKKNYTKKSVLLKRGSVRSIEIASVCSKKHLELMILTSELDMEVNKMAWTVNMEMKRTTILTAMSLIVLMMSLKSTGNLTLFQQERISTNLQIKITSTKNLDTLIHLRGTTSL